MKKSSENEIVKFGFYLVAFLDILDQRSALRALDDLPRNDDERQQFVQTLKSTFGVVDGIRKWFDSFYHSFTDSTKLGGQLPDNVKSLYYRLKATELKFQRFADTMIMYVPLAEGSEFMPINGVFAILAASGATMLTSLAAGHPLRGAIEVGIGGEMYENEIYGSCLNDAVSLESQIAHYPRIVVGPQTVSYLISVKDKEGTDLFTAYQKKLAGSCLNVLAQDVDGFLIVDYLGKHFKQVMKDAKIEEELIPKAFRFVDDQAKRWQQERNSKLAFRYNLLRQYFAARLSE